jgi:uncharacterized membrane protein YbaN (DUF454 family)
MKNEIIKIFYIFFGSISLLLGIIGIFLPLLPTTPFILLASWCFFKSSPRLHKWIRQQPHIGKALLDWETDRSISKNSKLLSISMIIISIIIIWLKVRFFLVRLSVSLLMLLISIYIYSRKTHTSQK